MKVNGKDYPIYIYINIVIIIIIIIIIITIIIIVSIIILENKNCSKPPVSIYIHPLVNKQKAIENADV